MKRKTWGERSDSVGPQASRPEGTKIPMATVSAVSSARKRDSEIFRGMGSELDELEDDSYVEPPMPAAKEKAPAKSGSQTARQQRDAAAQPQAPEMMEQD